MPGVLDDLDPAALPWQRAAWPDEDLTASPPWHAWFTSSWRTPAAGAGAAELGELGLLEVARPLIVAAQQRLRGALAGLGLPDALTGLPGMLAAQPPLAWLRLCVLPAMALELAVASREGRLTGESPASRFGSYVDSLASPDTALAVWRRYPVLARQVCDVLSDWVDARASFARHLTDGLPRVQAVCAAGQELGGLVRVQFGAAETHRHGRTVALVEFERGTVVYKPRSMAIDSCFDRLLGWFNETGVPFPLRRLRVLEAGDHGWSEHVAAAPCPPAGLPGYFWRLGALLALTYLAHGFDLHADNVIAVGSDPVVVDTEALFHTEGSQPVVRQSRLGDPAAGMLASSVLASGLLPGPLVMADVVTGRPFGVDISPMGITRTRRSLIRLPRVRADGTDELRLVYSYFEVPAPAGRLAVTGGAEASPAAYRGDLLAGFTAAYHRISEAGEWLLGPGGPLGGCAGVPVRLVQLSTFLYVRLLIESWHPDFLRAAGERDRCLSRVAAGWKGVPHRAALVGAETAALRRGEVPVFVTQPGCRDVWLEDGTRLPEVLSTTALAEIGQRLRRMGPDDLRQQVTVIDAALAAARPPAAVVGTASAAPPAPAPPSADGPVAGGPPARAELLAAAQRIAARLAGTAVRAEGRIGWLTTEVVDAQHHRLAPAGLDLAGGLPGIGLFLSYLAAVTGDGAAAGLAGEVAAEVTRRCEAAAVLGPPWPGAGGLGTLAGPVYYLAHAASVHGRPEYAEAASRLLPVLEQVLRAGRCRELPGLAEGPAGCLTALLALAAVHAGEQELALAQVTADLLAGQAAAGGSGPTDAAAPGPAYGLSGPALALARWHARTGEQGAAAAARSLLRADPVPGREAGWCLGATGAGLARLACAASPVMADIRADLEREAARCVRAVAAAPPPPDDSLCHGRFGMTELLATASALPRPGPALAQSQPAARQALAALCATISGDSAWRPALPGPVPGLLTGLAGIGYGLLRLASPELVPRVLLFEPPRPPGPAPREGSGDHGIH